MSSSSVSNHLPPGAPLVPRTVRAWLPLLVHPHPPDVAPRAAVADHQGGVADTRAELRTNLLLKGESIAEDKNNGEYLLSTMIPSPCSGSSHILSSQLQPKPPLCSGLRHEQ